MSPQMSLNTMLNMDLVSMLEGLDNGNLTSRALVEYYIDRVEKLNPRFKPVAYINPDALAIANDLDAQRAQGTIMGPLHGIPFMVKDSIVTADKMDTSGGSRALAGARWPYEATVISRLQAAGAILLGKTAMSNWGGYWSSTAPSGWSTRFGQATGAFHDRQTPAMSSFGAGVAASLGLAAIQIGCETDGSITLPSFFNGVVGLKPTPGLTSRFAVVPIDPDRDTIGPVGRWVKDVALVLQSIAGKDPKDPLTYNIPHDPLPDYVVACDALRIKSMRIAVPESTFELLHRQDNPTLAAALENAAATMERLGATVIRGHDLATFRPWVFSQWQNYVEFVHFKEALVKFLATLSHNPHGLHTLEDVMAWHEADPDPDAHFTYPDEFKNSMNASADAPEYKAGLEQLAIWERETHEFMDAHCVDIVMSVTYPNQFYVGRMTSMSVPMGRYGSDEPVVLSRTLVARGPNVPFGLYLRARSWQEEKILACAYAYEQATKQILSNSKAPLVKD